MGIPATSTNTPLTSAGNVKASAGDLFWIIACNTTGNGLKCIFNNATSGAGSKKFSVGVPGDDTKFIVFPIALHFSTGIRVGTLETGLEVTCGYV